MKYRVTKLVSVFVAVAALIVTSCTEDVEYDYYEIEQEVFDEWMALNHPDLLDNRQDDGYYIDLISAGDTSSRAIADTICWVKYEFTGTDLAGNICLTRDELTAWQQGTFTTSTYYCPYYRLSSEDDFTTLEGTHLALINELTIGDTSTYLYNGAEFTLYMPSSLVGTSGLTGSGGYEGQYSLSALVPLIANIKILDVILNPVEIEGEDVDYFAENNGGLTISAESEDDDSDEASTSDEDVDTNAWTNAVDSIPQLYIKSVHFPTVGGTTFNYTNPYYSQVPDSPYNTYTMAELDEMINQALLDRFYPDDDDDDDEDEEEGDIIDIDGDTEVWYIGRFLDGFIFDTNIDEVKEIIYGSVDSTGYSVSFNAEEDEESYIYSWYYSIPQLRYGQWAAILTTSTYAYGSSGLSGYTSSSTSYDYSSYYDMYNYYNSYYGSSYYSSYYSNYNYYNSYYNYYNYDYDYTSTTTTTIITEIPAYTPLLFEIYIEPSDDDDDDDE